LEKGLAFDAGGRTFTIGSLPIECELLFEGFEQRHIKPGIYVAVVNTDEVKVRILGVSTTAQS